MFIQSSFGSHPNNAGSDWHAFLADVRFFGWDVIMLYVLKDTEVSPGTNFSWLLR